jgi:hypothetical protein
VRLGAFGEARQRDRAHRDQVASRHRRRCVFDLVDEPLEPVGFAALDRGQRASEPRAPDEMDNVFGDVIERRQVAGSLRLGGGHSERRSSIISTSRILEICSDEMRGAGKIPAPKRCADHRRAPTIRDGSADQRACRERSRIAAP